MKKILILIVMLFFFQHLSFSQDQHLLDSLQTLLKTAKQDTNKAKILNQLSAAYWGNNPDKAMDYARQTLALSEQIGYKKGIGNAYNSMGAINYFKGEYTSALELHNKALQIRQEIGDKKGIAGSYNNIGNIYSDQGNSPEALKYFFDALKINEETRNKNWQIINYNGIGTIYGRLGNYPEALKFYFFALKISEEIADKMSIAFSYGNIGTIYSFQGNYPEALNNLLAALKIDEEFGDKNAIAQLNDNIGTIYARQGNYPEALKNFFVSLKIGEEIGDKSGIAESYNNIGNIYLIQGNVPEALKNFFVSLKIGEEIGDKSGIAGSYNNIGNIYTRQKKYSDAYQYLHKALSLSKEIRSLENIKESYINLAKLDSAEGNFKQALEHYKMYITTRDSLINEKNTKKTVQQQMQYEFDKKESLAKAEQEKKDVIAQRELQKQKWVRNGFIGGFAVVMLFAFIFLRQRNKISNEKKISEEERKKAEAEKKRSEELLLNILPYEVAEELKSTGTAKAKTYSMVSVMFTDFKDFTRISEKVSAELLVNEIHYCYSAFDAILEKHKIEKIKTIGDAYMCASGLPVLSYTHAEDLVNAAIEILNFMQERKKEKEAKTEIPFELRIGIHTGPVVAGIVGVKKFAYDIWGDTVNIAARMEQNSEAGKINISGSTYGLVKDKFNCVYRGKIEAKNKGEVEMYFVETEH